MNKRSEARAEWKLAGACYEVKYRRVNMQKMRTDEILFVSDDYRERKDAPDPSDLDTDG
jgi:hypothetical protein